MFAEVLEHLGTYYYSAMVFDAYFLTAGFDFADCSTIAQMTQRNRDNVRAVFHYGLCVEWLLKDQRFDEALFAAQFIVSIFEQYRMYRESISFLAGLLSKIFPKSLAPRIVRSVPLKTARPTKSSVTAVNCAQVLASLLIKKRYFSVARALLDEVDGMPETRAFSRAISFERARGLVKQNKLRQFLMSLPRLELTVRRPALTARTIVSVPSFELSVSALMRLSRAYLDRGLYTKAFTYSDGVIQVLPRISRDLPNAYFLRGKALACQRTQVIGDGISRVEERDSIMSGIFESSPRIKYSLTELTSDALSSLKVA